ncbi:MAG: L,D-transpeptidase family protein, partial [Psychrobacter sp.]
MSFSRLNKGKRGFRLLLSFSIPVICGGVIMVAAKSTSNQRQPIPNDVTIDKVFVDKSDRTLQLLSANQVIKTYHIALGDSPVGHKQQEGDQRTPVGTYTLDYKNENSIAHRSIHISYPNEDDKKQARTRGVSPGGDIMIHGQMNGYGYLASINQKYDWTD